MENAGSRHKERRSTVVNESSSRSFLASRPRGHRTKACAGCPRGPLRPETYPSLVSCALRPPTRKGGRGGGEERNGTAGSVSEPYISAGTNCPIIHSVRQLRCSPLIHRCLLPSVFSFFFSLLLPSLFPLHFASPVVFPRQH